MTKKNLIILGLVTVVIMVGVVAFLPKKQNTKQVVDTKVIIPAQVKTDYSSDTGAKTITQTKEEYDEIYLIKKLRNSMPMERDYFVIDFDYKINKFIVGLKDVKRGTAEFDKWLNDTGYNAIPKEYFQIK